MNWKPWTWFPYTRAGRQTLIYLAIAASAPIVTGSLIFALTMIREWADVPALERLNRFANIADMMAWGLLIILVSFACFISIRAMKLDVKSGTAEVQADREEDDDIIRTGDDVTVTKP